MLSQPDSNKQPLTVQLSDRASTILEERARRLGKDVNTVASDIIEEAEAPVPVRERSVAERLAAFEEFARSMREWGQKNLPPDHVIDDSRESIYEGCGE
jgi:hypothetical protein